MKVTLTTYMHEDAPALTIEAESPLESELLAHLGKKGAIFEMVAARRDAPTFAMNSGCVRIPRSGTRKEPGHAK